MLTFLERETLAELYNDGRPYYRKLYGRSRAVVAGRLYKQGFVWRQKFAGSQQYEYLITPAGRAALKESTP